MNKRILGFIGVNISVGILISLIFLFAIFLSIILVSKYSLNNFIKNRNINRGLTNITYIILIISLIVVLPILREPLDVLVNSSIEYRKIIKNSKYTENIYRISIKEDKNRKWEFDSLKYFNDEENDNNKRIIDLYDNLEEMDSLYRFNPKYIFHYNSNNDLSNEKIFLSFEINDKVFSDINFIVEGKKVNVKDPNELNIFMDKDTFFNNKWTRSSFTLDNIDIKIYLFDKVDYINLSTEKYENYDNESFPIFIYTGNKDYFVKNIFEEGIYIDGDKVDEINTLFKNKGYDKSLGLFKKNEDLRIYKNEFIKTNKQNLIELLPGFISLITIFISFAIFYIFSKEKEFKIKKSLGYSNFLMLSKFIVEIIIPVLIFIVFSIFILKYIDYYGLILILLIEIIMSIFVGHYINGLKIKDI